MSAVLAVFLPIALAYVATFAWIGEMWYFREAYYSHGPLVVAGVAWLVWAQRARWGAQPVSVDARGWLLLGPGLLLHLAGAALTIDSLSAASLVLTVPGAVLLACGPRRLRALLPVLGLSMFAIPTPIVVQSRLAFELKEIAISGGLWLANAFGAGAERFGAEVRIPGEAEGLIVADACSGLRSLVALVTLGYCIAFLMGEQRGARRWILLAAAAPIAVATNALRIGVICLLAGWKGTEFASTTGHDLVSAAVWVVDLALLFALDAVLVRVLRRRSG